MKIFNKKEEVPTEGSSVPRIAKLETPDLYSWFNNVLISLGRSFDMWRYEDGPNEVRSHVETLNELWKEIEHRNNDK
jgi:hypothetical protein